jgi:PAS domain S-box-containing protein
LRPDHVERLFRRTRFECIVVHDNGTILAANPGITSVLGYSTEELLGRTMMDLTIPSFRDELVHRVSSQYEGPFACAVQHRDGREVVMECMQEVVEIDNRRYLVAHGHDVSDTKVLEESLSSSRDELRRLESALQRKDEALKEFLWQLHDKRHQVAADIQANINKIVKPLLRKLAERVAESDRHSLVLIERFLDDLTSPFVSVMESRFANLTPREMEICNMVKNGFRSKEIAATLNISSQTVLTQRKQIRRKLGIANKSVNLVTFLNNIDSEL